MYTYIYNKMLLAASEFSGTRAPRSVETWMPRDNIYIYIYIILIIQEIYIYIYTYIYNKMLLEGTGDCPSFLNLLFF